MASKAAAKVFEFSDDDGYSDEGDTAAQDEDTTAQEEEEEEEEGAPEEVKEKVVVAEKKRQRKSQRKSKTTKRPSRGKAVSSKKKQQNGKGPSKKRKKRSTKKKRGKNNTKKPLSGRKNPYTGNTAKKAAKRVVEKCDSDNYFTLLQQIINKICDMRVRVYTAMDEAGYSMLTEYKVIPEDAVEETDAAKAELRAIYKVFWDVMEKNKPVEEKAPDAWYMHIILVVCSMKDSNFDNVMSCIFSHIFSSLDGNDRVAYFISDLFGRYTMEKGDDDKEEIVPFFKKVWEARLESWNMNLANTQKAGASSKKKTKKKHQKSLFHTCHATPSEDKHKPLIDVYKSIMAALYSPAAHKERALSQIATFINSIYGNPSGKFPTKIYKTMLDGLKDELLATKTAKHNYIRTGKLTMTILSLNLAPATEDDPTPYDALVPSPGYPDGKFDPARVFYDVGAEMSSVSDNAEGHSVEKIATEAGRMLTDFRYVSQMFLLMGAMLGRL